MGGGGGGGGVGGGGGSGGGGQIYISSIKYQDRAVQKEPF